MINFTFKQYFLLHKTSIKLLFCKATYIIAELQRVSNPECSSKLQNSSAKVSRNSRKTFAEKNNLLGFWGPLNYHTNLGWLRLCCEPFCATKSSVGTRRTRIPMFQPLLMPMAGHRWVPEIN